jgi:hypothetical protein
MKRALLTILYLSMAFYNSNAQSAGDYFNRAANEYIYQNEKIALNTIDSGLKSYPGDESLLALRDKILKDKQKQDQQKKQEEQKQEEQKQKQEEQQKQQQQDEKSEDGEDPEKKEQQQDAKPEETEEKGEEIDKPPMSRPERLEEMNLTEEKARMILEAMKNNEIQYIQQNKRKPTKRPDSNKPDW